MKVLNHMNLLSASEMESLNQYIEKPIINHNGIQTGQVSAEILS